MVATHEVDVQTSHDEHVALAEDVQAPHNAVEALKLGDTVDLGGFQHRLRAAENTWHVGKQVFGELVAHGSAEAEQVRGEEMC